MECNSLPWFFGLRICPLPVTAGESSLSRAIVVNKLQPVVFLLGRPMPGTWNEAKSKQTTPGTSGVHRYVHTYIPGTGHQLVALFLFLGRTPIGLAIQATARCAGNLKLTS